MTPADPDARRATGASRGFTLLETLVAMAVFGLAALALLKLSGENARVGGHVESRLLAGMVADNLAVQAFALPNPPAFGATSGTTRFAGRDLRWVQTVSTTPLPDMLRIDIRVLEGRQDLAGLTVYRDTGR